jgi:penicillin amidase
MVQKSLPALEGEVILQGLQGEVSVWRDEKGVPHIEAENLQDLYVAQGYVTAQDRLFQMDLSRRQASGQLSEVIGEATVETDKFFRTLGLRRAAELSYASYSEEAQQILASYAKGVNAYIQESIEENKLPIEFTLIGYEPREWEVVDSLAIGKYMAYDLGGHWEGQAFRYYLAQNFSEEEALDLFPTYPENGPAVIQALKDHPLDVAQSFASAVIPHQFNGSNNWVVSGDKTASGAPILADDPHLGLGTPAIWYQTHLRTSEVEVSGVIFAGVPGIIVGHNEHIAWGVTNVGPDVQDLYIEKRNPQNATEFEYMGQWEPAQVINEEIKVKDKDPLQHEVLITRHGPIMSEFAHDNKPDTALSMRWTALDATTELEAVLNMNKAKDWEDFKEALTYFQVPAQNFVFASKDGTIAYRANGLIPIREKGDSSVPVPGWTDEYEWKGYIPWEELPTIVNPDEGFISTANNKVVEDSYPYHISHTWAQPYRQQRIRDVLSDLSNGTVDDMKKLQFDHYNLQAEEFVPLLLGELKKEKIQSQLRDIDHKALVLLEEWNYEDHKDSGAPLLFHLWMQQFSDVLFIDKMDQNMYKMFEGRAQIVDQLIRNAINGNPGPWVEQKGGLAEVTRLALQNAIDQSIKLQGNQPEKWKWGKFHSVTFAHPLSSIKPLHLLFNPTPVPMGGSRVTVGAASFNGRTGEVNHGAAWRTVVDVSDLTKSYDVIGPGQSGHVLSEWYDNQINDWTTGQYHITHTKDNEYQKEGYRLVLKPKE